MRIGIGAGGTGGHLFPGIALAQTLQSKTDIQFFGRKTAIEEAIVREYGYKFFEVGVFRKFSDLTKPEFFKSIFKILFLIKRSGIDLVFGFGGYVSFPLLFASFLAGLPIYLCEQNVVLGSVNRIFCAFAKKVFLSFPNGEDRKMVFVGNPLRKELVKLAKRKSFCKDDGRFSVLVIGGSQGSRKINEVFTSMLASFPEISKNISIVHQTGSMDYERVKEFYKKLNVCAKVYPFVKDMGRLYLNAEVALARAGATTISELALFGIPSILVPYPFAKDNHQVKNASFLEKLGGCIKIDEKDFNPASLHETLAKLLLDFDTRKRMSKSLREFCKPRAAQKIADYILKGGHDGEF